MVKITYKKNCPDCGAEQCYGRKDHYKSAIKGKWKCKKCSGFNNNFAGKYNKIAITWFEVKKRGGISRGYDWNISIEDVWNLYEKQNGKCALSGIDIGWDEKGLKATASIDRIDNNKGYLTDNVQLVHKKINMMKGKLTVEEFKQFCKLVAQNSEKW